MDRKLMSGVLELSSIYCSVEFLPSGQASIASVLYVHWEHKTMAQSTTIP